MNKGISLFLLKFYCLFISVIISIAHQAHVRAKAFRRLHLTDGRAVRHADQRRDIVLASRQRHALSVISRAAGNNPPGLFLVAETADFVIGASHLKASCHLQIFCL